MYILYISVSLYLSIHLSQSYGLRQFLLTNLIEESSGQFRWKLNLDGILHSLTHIRGAVPHQQPFLSPTLFIKGARSPYLTVSSNEWFSCLFELVDWSTDFDFSCCFYLVFFHQLLGCWSPCCSQSISSLRVDIHRRSWTLGSRR